LAQGADEPGADLDPVPEPATSRSRPALSPVGAPAEPLGYVVSETWGRRDFVTRRLLACADTLGVVVAMGAASLSVGIRELPLGLVLLSLPTLPVWIVLFKVYGLYDRDIKRISHATLDDLPWLFHALLLGGLLFWAYLKISPYHQLTFDEAVVFGATAMAVISLLRFGVRRLVLSTLGPERVLIAGIGPITGSLLRKIRQHPEYGLEPIGVISEAETAPYVGLPVLGPPEDLEQLASRHAAERVVICRADFTDDEVLGMMQACQVAAIKVSLLPDTVDALGPSVEVDEVEGVTVLGVNPAVLSRTSRLMKRMFDLVVAGLLLLVCLPFLAIAAVAIKFDSPGPVLFRQERIGKGGQRFRLLKLRTMVSDAEARRADLLSESADENWLHIEHDPRITRVGRLLRLASIDELPQLWNVLRGQMSMVGPRPLVPSENDHVMGWHRTRLDLTPGLTGPWQVMGRNAIPFQEMVKLDYLYVTDWSLWSDVKLLVRTLPVVVGRRGA
jgi:exopolysaccharide biosynthesis polyprenyl glycosylphosphotransferase